jgi:hypothetical protein
MLVGKLVTSVKVVEVDTMLALFGSVQVTVPQLKFINAAIISKIHAL